MGLAVHGSIAGSLVRSRHWNVHRAWVSHPRTLQHSVCSRARRSAAEPSFDCELIPSGPFQVGDRSTAGTNEIVRCNREHVDPRSRRRPHLVVLQQIRINEHAQLCAVTKRRNATVGLSNPLRISQPTIQQWISQTTD